MIDPQAARLAMVEGQLRTNKVTDDAVLEAFLTVPRERFVPVPLQASAYVDDDIPLGGGRYLLEPMVLARLIQLADIDPRERVLDIGAATGYTAALLSRLAAQVVAVEAEPQFVAAARRTLLTLGCDNVTLVEGPLAAGDPTGRTYHVILIEGAIATVPEAIARQLAPGGRLLTVVKRGEGMGQATIMTHVAGILSHRPIFDAGTPPLAAFQREPGFVF
jgi:protein-L-isoaspartate(D-aspartate) O-methyltransferase